MMRDIFAIVVGVGGFVTAIILFHKKSIDWKGFLAISLVGLLTCVVVADLPYIKTVSVKGGSAGELALDLQRKVDTVSTKTEEVERLAQEVRETKEEILLLAQNANTTTDKIQKSEASVASLAKNVEATKTEIQNIYRQVQQEAAATRKVANDVVQFRDDFRKTWRSLLESYYYVIMTRNLFPPPQRILIEIDRHLNVLAAYAYPDAAERERAIARMQTMIQGATNPAPTPKK
jgi:hypothetical protein